MTSLNLKAISMLAVASTLAACASTPVMTREGGNFYVALADAGISSGPARDLRKEAQAAAVEHCAADNKKVPETVKLDDSSVKVGGPSALSLTFKCVAKK